MMKKHDWIVPVVATLLVFCYACNTPTPDKSTPMSCCLDSSSIYIQSIPTPTSPANAIAFAPVGSPPAFIPVVMGDSRFGWKICVEQVGSAPAFVLKSVSDETCYLGRLPGPGSVLMMVNNSSPDRGWNLVGLNSIVNGATNEISIIDPNSALLSGGVAVPPMALQYSTSTVSISTYNPSMTDFVWRVTKFP